jgi:hypothetical protein
MSGNAMFILYYIGGASFFGQLALLYLQARAYRRNHHPSFVLLIASSVIGVAGTCVTYAQFMSPELLAFRETIGWVVASLLTIQLVAATWGAAWLFNSYNLLALRSSA